MLQKIIFSMILGLLNAGIALATDTLNLANLSNHEGLIANIHGLGGHTNYCVNLNVLNSTGRTVYLKILPGTLLIPADSNSQNLLVVEKNGMHLAPGVRMRVKLRAFCALYYKHSPSTNEEFVATTAKPELVTLADYINHYPASGSIQEAVWVVANGSLISSLNRKDEELIKLVSKLSKQPIPDYTAVFVNSGSELFTNRVARIQGDIQYTVRNEDMVSFQIYDATGRLRKTIFDGRWVKRGTHTEDYDIDVSKLKKGVYFIKIYQQNQLISEKRFEI
jgi:hypothetical protein